MCICSVPKCGSRPYICLKINKKMLSYSINNVIEARCKLTIGMGRYFGGNSGLNNKSERNRF